MKQCIGMVKQSLSLSRCSDLVEIKTSEGSDYNGSFCLYHYQATVPFYKEYKRITKDALSLLDNFVHTFQNSSTNDLLRCLVSLKRCISKRVLFMKLYVFPTCRDSGHDFFLSQLQQAKTKTMTYLKIAYSKPVESLHFVPPQTDPDLNSQPDKTEIKDSLDSKLEVSSIDKIIQVDGLDDQKTG